LYFACVSSFFHYDEPPPTVIYTLSLHDALPISIYNAYTKTIVDPTMRSLNERIANLLGVNRPHSVADFYEEGDVRYALRASAYHVVRMVEAYARTTTMFEDMHPIGTGLRGNTSGDEVY